MIKLKLYRHVYHKDIYLARNWSLCGGGAESEFYYATRDVMKALTDANRTDFESWMHRFLDDDKKTQLKAKMKDTKEVNIDGYKGIITKELVFPVKEFALVEIKES